MSAQIAPFGVPKSHHGLPMVIAPNEPHECARNAVGAALELPDDAIAELDEIGGGVSRSAGEPEE
jgi:hypothetical protein